MREQLDLESGVSLVGVVVVLVILGALAALAVTALPSDPGTAGRLQGLVPDDDLVDGGAAPRPRSPADAPATAACTITAQTLGTAWAAKHAADGTNPATLGELVATGYLSAAPDHRGYEYTLEAVGGRATGKVLVNGMPYQQGCAAAPHPGR
jgi:hypothetical protein